MNKTSLLESFIAVTLMFTAHQLGVETRHGHGRDVAIGTVMAVIGTAISYGVGLLLAFMLPAEFAAEKAAISAALSATDPVAVSALMVLFSRIATEQVKGWGIKLETESLFNDPIALFLFWLALGKAKDAIHGMVWAFALATLIVALSWLALKLFDRKISTFVRIITTVMAIVFGMQHHAALLSLSVAANYAMGVIEAPYHNDSHRELDKKLFFVGNTVLTLVIGFAGWIVIQSSLANLYLALIGGVFMVVVRIVSRTGGVGLRQHSWREMAIGGSGAIGVLSITISYFNSEGKTDVAAILAGAVVGSLIVFVPWTVYLFKRAIGINDNH